MVKVSLGSFGAFSTSNKLVSRKWLAVEQNGVKVGPRRVYEWSFGSFPFFENLVSRKCLVVERNRVKFGSQLGIYIVYKVL